LPFGQAPNSASNKNSQAQLVQKHQLWLARAWFAGQAFQSRHIKHAQRFFSISYFLGVEIKKNFSL
jgi:predicted nicotinamide N-methyase